MTDFGIFCICGLIGYVVRTVVANRNGTLAERLDAQEERIEAIECVVFEDDDDDGGPDGGEELPEGPTLRLVGGGK